ncbi:MAG TPA: hypothetical protein VK545_15950 [Streptomyces sp.]|nr:hypothetical protein [Streptomyces sp.]
MIIDRRPLPLEPRLGHLLQQAQAKLARASAEARAAHGVDGRDLAVLGVSSTLARALTLLADEMPATAE